MWDSWWCYWWHLDADNDKNYHDYYHGKKLSIILYRWSTCDNDDDDRWWWSIGDVRC